MRRVLAWLFGARRTYAERVACQWKSEALEVLKRLGRAEKALVRERIKIDGSFRRFEKLVARMETEIKQAESTIAKYDHAEEALTNQIRILSEVDLPNYATSNEAMRQMVQTLIALDVSRQAIVMDKKER